MDTYLTLHDLIENDLQSRQLYERFPREVQVALQEQRQNIHTYAQLCSLADSYQKRGQ